MKVISIGTDRKLFEENSAVRQRQIGYGKFFEEIHIIVATKNTEDQKNLPTKLQISNNIFVYSTHSSNRLFFFKDAIRIIKNIIKNKNHRDFIISTQDPFETGLVGALLKLFFNLPLHVQVHTDLMHKYFRQSSVLNKIRFFMAEFVLKYSDRARAVSERVKNSIQDFSKNVDVLPIKTEIKIELGERIEKPFPFTLLMICRLEKEKNIETVLHVIKDLKEKNIGLCLVGDGSQRNNLKQMVRDLQISDRVVFAGWQSNLAPYYKMADVFISSSLYEGYGISTMEAAYFEKPLILSETGITGYIFKDDSAFICDAKNPTCFLKSVLSLYQNKNLVQKMGQSAKMTADRYLNSENNYFKEYADSILKTSDNFRKRNFMSRVFNFKKTVFNSFIALRYFMCGITSAAINILSLYVLTDFVGIWYLYSSILAFLVSLVISFILQKFVVFKDTKTDKINHQFSRFFIVAILSVITNTIIMFICVDVLGIWYILSQIIAGFFVMFQNFILYKFFIFNK